MRSYKEVADAFFESLIQSFNLTKLQRSYTIHENVYNKNYINIFIIFHIKN